MENFNNTAILEPKASDVWKNSYWINGYCDSDHNRDVWAVQVIASMVH